MARFPSLILLVLALLVGPVFALPPPVRGGETFTMTQGANGVYTVANASGGGVAASRAITAGSVMMGAGAVNVLDTFTGSGPAGALPVTVNRSVDWDSVAGAAAVGLAATRSPWGAAAAGAYDLWKQLRIKPDGNGGALRDAGAAPQVNSTPGTQVGEATVFVGGAPYGTCGSDVLCYVNTYKTAEERSALCATGSLGNLLRLEGSNAVLACVSPASVTTACPAIGGVPQTVGPDGKCPSGAYEPVSVEQVKAALNDPAVVNQAKAQAPTLAKDALNQGQQLPATEQSLSGPATQPGVPQTVPITYPDGTTGTQTVTPTVQYTYTGGDTITYTTVFNNQTTNNVDNTSTGSGGTNVDICKANPTASACAQLGTGSVDPTPPQQVPFSIDTVAMPDGSACPAPVQWSVFGRAYEFSFTPMCDVAITWVRPVILVLAVALGAFVFVGGLKS